jgi:hypothetical protein
MESVAKVGVGSIAHILKSAFKNVYEEEKAECDALAANELAESVALEHATRNEDLIKVETVEKARIDPKKARIVSTAQSPTAAVQRSGAGAETSFTGNFERRKFCRRDFLHTVLSAVNVRDITIQL